MIGKRRGGVAVSIRRFQCDSYFTLVRYSGMAAAELAFLNKSLLVCLSQLYPYTMILSKYKTFILTIILA